ncbi:DUF6939 family protein [Kutzneria kofuensis]|uniref:Uncharacterized protein n=1 Tax=Kutzneria kofuensis TaxID=103725 RepID=A0A7W9NDS1_9PSEU|nr:hypothetical protein [Kutzneria kofuensis]MBB5889537.1 hypothetical protein [Kutzneria kofuensis]
MPQAVLRIADRRGRFASSGRCSGIATACGGSGLLDYEATRRRIYLPAYRWVLDNRVQDVLAELRELGAERPLVLVDYTTNGDVANLATPLSHAALVARYLTGRWDG